MTRGRKKDMTLAPSRALIQQREYRNRKQQYITSLEDKCKRLETENSELKTEVRELRLQIAARGIIPTDKDVAAASEDLLNKLNASSAALNHFRQLAFDKPLSEYSHHLSDNSLSVPLSSTIVHPIYPLTPDYDSPRYSPSNSGSSNISQHSEMPIPVPSMSSMPGPSSFTTQSWDSLPTTSAAPNAYPPGNMGQSAVVEPETDCCWGLFDCGGEHTSSGQQTGVPAYGAPHNPSVQLPPQPEEFVSINGHQPIYRRNTSDVRFAS
ncbi:hypothetical protein K474DRAFT_1678693 [Panus rudis PR-1116 ss-1]|nr:hypothetical protein K474DRAFT_1678693 [Panus rudis PR-1116 ss-1]